ncbi:secondary thiamine-phosphate synthase enzyme YjbQ [Zhongshania sp.]|jgi:secondary thiamine-phosphate synthase enzyme|uniref:secondary thiamine-phosphate synthase enzyme YjbQ n=1 Tax=Zhongshania sp. TaxID=1971902 RepID=UPI0039E41541
MIERLALTVSGQGLHSVTSMISETISRLYRGQDGLCTLFIQHTSASLLVQENYDDSARRDLEHWLNRLVPEHDPLYTHTLEGSDDMPAHIKASLTATSLSIPIIDGQLALGSWQGIYLWEHRHAATRRNIIMHIGS